MHFLFVLLLQNQTVIAIQAPRASFLEVPDPDEVGILGSQFTNMLTFYVVFLSVPFPQDIGFCQKQHKLIVRSTTGPIGVYLVRYLLREFEKSRH